MGECLWGKPRLGILKTSVSPVSSKSVQKHFVCKTVKLERNADNSETLKKQGRKIRHQSSPSKFAEKFTGNVPKIRQAKIKISPQIKSEKSSCP